MQHTTVGKDANHQLNLLHSLQQQPFAVETKLNIRANTDSCTYNDYLR